MPVPVCDAELLFRPEDQRLRYLPEGPCACGRNRLSWVAIQHGPAAKFGSLNVLDTRTRTNQTIDLAGRPGFAFPTRLPTTWVIGLERQLGLLNVQTDSWTVLVDGIDDPAGKVTSLTAIAFYYHKMQMADEVTQVLESAGQIAREAENPRQRANSVARIAMTLNRIQRVDESVAMFDESLKLASQIPTEESKAYALVDIARQLGDAGRSSSAREALLLAEELANGLSDRSQQKPLMDKIRLIHSRLRSIRVNASP